MEKKRKMKTKCFELMILHCLLWEIYWDTYEFGLAMNKSEVEMSRTEEDGSVAHILKFLMAPDYFDPIIPKT